MTTIEKHTMRPGESRTFDIDLSDYLYDGATIGTVSAAVTMRRGGTPITAGSPVVIDSVVYIALTAGSGAALAPDIHSVALTIPIDNPTTVPDESPKHILEIVIRSTDG